MSAPVYKGWSISFDAKPIRQRDFDWCAQSPDFDMDMHPDGTVWMAGEQLFAATYEELLQEIEDYLAGDDEAELAALHLASLSPERRTQLEREWERK
jgi:hypothetical protein